MNAHSEIEHDMEGGELDLKLDTLMGDIRDEMLTRIKHLKATWNLLTESEQHEVANGLELFSRGLIRKAVGMLTRHEFPHAVVTLSEFKVKGGKDIEAKISCPNIELNREALGNHVGDMCMLLMVDSETFFGERAPVQTDPDQPGLNLDGDGEGDADPDAEDEIRALPPPSDAERKGNRRPKPEDLD